MRLVGEQVRERRERLALSIEDVCAKAGVSPHTWVRAEHSEEIRPSSARRIASVLGVEPSQLMEEPASPKKAGAPPPPPETSEEERREELRETQELVLEARDLLEDLAETYRPGDDRERFEKLVSLAVLANYGAIQHIEDEVGEVAESRAELAVAEAYSRLDSVVGRLLEVFEGDATRGRARDTIRRRTQEIEKRTA